MNVSLFLEILNYYSIITKDNEKDDRDMTSSNDDGMKTNSSKSVKTKE